MHVALRYGWSLGLVVAGGCAHGVMAAPTPTATPTATVTARQLPNDVRWFRVAAEYRALARQAYQVASDRLPELSRGQPSGRWAVILDVDETMLDNSEYERRRFVLDSSYTPASWDEWVKERAAPAIPGAVSFTRLVHQLGGRVAAVSNRDDRYCGTTRENLRAVGIEPDILLCQVGAASDKNPRFERIQNGTAASGVPALTVVAWVGDNILDFPALSQASRTDSTALAQFGRRFFILPNPMYGSWETVREP